MPRYVLDISYKGTHFYGSQIQKEGPTIQASLDHALSTCLRVPVVTLAAGRTDSGVHARQMYIQFDYPHPLPTRFLYSVNSLLPKDISINKVYTTQDPDFNVRFHATSRSYRYRIARKKVPFDHEYSYLFLFPLNVTAMKEAAQSLLTFRSFESFCKSGGNNKTCFCDIQRAEWIESGDFLELHLSADRFLRGMVRAVVGTCMMVGKDKISVEKFKQIVEAKDRKLAGPSVFPGGLFLEKIDYEPGALIPFED